MSRARRADPGSFMGDRDETRWARTRARSGRRVVLPEDAASMPAVAGFVHHARAPSGSTPNRVTDLGSVEL
jgi:hypothetical protein